MNRLFVIQEHDADKAGLHWDIRFEDKGVLKSWVIPKHRLPEFGEKLLAIPVEDHSLDYANFEGIIEEGYGAGSVKLVHCDQVEVSTLTDTKIIFEYDGNKYDMFKMNGQNKWLVTNKG